MQQWNARRRLGAVTVVVLVLMTGCRSSGMQESFDDPSVEENFRSGCELALDDANGVETIQAGAEQVCSCAFDDIKETISFEDFVAVDDRLREDIDLLQASPLEAGSTEAQIVEIVSSCIQNQ